VISILFLVAGRLARMHSLRSFGALVLFSRVLLVVGGRGLLILQSCARFQKEVGRMFAHLLSLGGMVNSDGHCDYIFYVV